MGQLHIFDMDGTLLAGSACLEISRHVGQIDAVNAIEERWSRGEVGHLEFYELCLPLWGELSDGDIATVFRATRWMNGVEAVFRDIAGRGDISAVISLSPQFFVERLIDWGLGSAHGAEVYGGQTPDASRVTTPEGKITIARALMDRHGVSPAQTVAYGDSASDIPLFGELPHTVAVNGSARIRATASVCYDGDDLRGAYALGLALLGGYEAAA